MLPQESPPQAGNTIPSNPGPGNGESRPRALDTGGNWSSGDHNNLGAKGSAGGNDVINKTPAPTPDMFPNEKHMHGKPPETSTDRPSNTFLRLMQQRPANIPAVLEDGSVSRHNGVTLLEVNLLAPFATLRHGRFSGGFWANLESRKIFMRLSQAF